MNEIVLLSEAPVETEPVETTEAPDRAFLDTPFENYTVTEGLLLVIVLLLVVGFVWKGVVSLFHG